nr:ribonuclease H-like domain-containing protein [Tanacetum cinerariifolium]
QIIRSLHQEFAMTDLGPLNYFLGISVTRDSSGLFLSQKKYAVEILDRAHMLNCNPSRTPIDNESKLGSDGDSAFDPTLYRSLAGSWYFGLWVEVVFIIDYKFGCLFRCRFRLDVLLLDARLQVTVFFLETTNSLGPLSVSRRFFVPVQRQSIVVLPMLLLRHVGYAIYYRTKHIEIDIHFVRDLVAVGQVRVLHVPSRYQYADIFNKGLPSALFEEFCSNLSVWCSPALTAGEC